MLPRGVTSEHFQSTFLKQPIKFYFCHNYAEPTDGGIYFSIMVRGLCPTICSLTIAYLDLVVNKPPVLNHELAERHSWLRFKFELEGAVPPLCMVGCSQVVATVVVIPELHLA